MKKSHVRKLIDWNSNQVLYICRKMENVIRRNFTSVIMPPNFIHFRPKIGFKISLGDFTYSLSWLFRTVLKNKNKHSPLNSRTSLNSKIITAYFTWYIVPIFQEHLTFSGRLYSPQSTNNCQLKCWSLIFPSYHPDFDFWWKVFFSPTSFCWALTGPIQHLTGY